ncbi:MAG: OmpA family protein [Bacteroidota bacterium]|nr:OmpA family protein [Bacteroidota bacterium]
MDSYAQEEMLQRSLYFETGKSGLSEVSKSELDSIIDSLHRYASYSVFIKGNTDNIGDSLYNKKLSEKRVGAVQEYLKGKGIPPSKFSGVAFGMEKPIADNTTVEGKQKNRRVDVAVSFTRVDSSTSLPTIWELYKQTERKPQEFRINPLKDTALRCEYGTVVYIKANSFKLVSPCKSGPIIFKIKEDFLRSDMILDNLSTTSNGRIIETQGMVFTEASDCTGKKLSLIKGKDLVISVPTDKIVSDARIFQGNRTPHDSIMNWTVSNTSVLSNFTLNEIDCCHEWLGCGGSSACPFFFCKIKRFFRRLLGKKDGVKNPPRITPELENKCLVLQDLYNKYKVEDPGALVRALNQPLLDSFKVNTIEQLQDTLRKINLQKVEISYQNKTLNYDDFQFYIFNSPRLGWSNVDVFVDIKKEDMVTMKINMKADKNTDCKLVFKNRNFVIPADKKGKKYAFIDVPRGEAVWVVALKFLDGSPYLHMEEATIEDKTINVNLKVLTLEELKERLKLLNP